MKRRSPTGLCVALLVLFAAAALVVPPVADADLADEQALAER